MPCAVVEGDAPIGLQWLFNNQTIAPRHRITIVELGDRNVILSIASVDEKHVGNYTCVARNLAGHHNITAPLLVNGKALFSFLFSSLCFLLHTVYCTVLVSVDFTFNNFI